MATIHFWLPKPLVAANIGHFTLIFSFGCYLQMPPCQLKNNIAILSNFVKDVHPSTDIINTFLWLNWADFFALSLLRISVILDIFALVNWCSHYMWINIFVTQNCLDSNRWSISIRLLQCNTLTVQNSWTECQKQGIIYWFCPCLSTNNLFRNF